ncbi:MAG: response regulator transcription factor [Lachnospiraceae bacterium]|nr:response regulator transcription factor [Lachnospiraceae bacterium]
MSAVRVMVVDDQATPRHLMEMYVEQAEGYELACSIDSAVAADVYLLKEKVDLILMDILMSDGSNGLDTAFRIKKNYPKIKIIAVTSMPEFSWLKKAKSIGVDSFWYKETDEQTIKEVMDLTMAGQSVYPGDSPEVKLGLASSKDFTSRELEVLQVITTGVTNQEVADRLGISEYTVKTHVRNMLEKTGYASRTELAIKARVAGIAIGEVKE